MIVSFKLGVYKKRKNNSLLSPAWGSQDSLVIVICTCDSAGFFLLMTCGLGSQYQIEIFQQKF